jgi:hypothetical protein
MNPKQALDEILKLNQRVVELVLTGYLHSKKYAINRVISECFDESMDKITDVVSDCRTIEEATKRIDSEFDKLMSTAKEKIERIIKQ